MLDLYSGVFSLWASQQTVKRTMAQAAEVQALLPAAGVTRVVQQAEGPEASASLLQW